MVQATDLCKVVVSRVSLFNFESAGARKKFFKLGILYLFFFFLTNTRVSYTR